MSNSRSRSLLNRDRLVQNALADPGLQARHGDDVDPVADEILEVDEEAGQVEQAATWFEVDEEVDSLAYRVVGIV